MFNEYMHAKLRMDIRVYIYIYIYIRIYIYIYIIQLLYNFCFVIQGYSLGRSYKIPVIDEMKITIILRRGNKLQGSKLGGLS